MYWDTSQLRPLTSQPKTLLIECSWKELTQLLTKEVISQDLYFLEVSLVASVWFSFIPLILQELDLELMLENNKVKDSLKGSSIASDKFSPKMESQVSTKDLAFQSLGSLPTEHSISGILTIYF